MSIEEEIEELKLEKEYLQKDKDKIFNEFVNRYSELEYTIRNLEKSIRVKMNIVRETKINQ